MPPLIVRIWIDPEAEGHLMHGASYSAVVALPAAARGALNKYHAPHGSNAKWALRSVLVTCPGRTHDIVEDHGAPFSSCLP